MDVRMTVLRHVVTGADTRFSESYLVAAVRQQVQCTRDQVWEALWGLVGDGMIFLDPAGQRSSTDNWQWRASALGTQAATGGSWEPRDPEGYLRRLRSFQPAIDEAALLYVEEALRAFNARCYLATSVMLGVAAESAFNDLAEAFVTANPTRTTKLRDALKDPRSSQNIRFRELRKALEPIRAHLPDGLADPVTLDAVADLLRTARNDAGHPTGKPIDEGTAHTHLYMGAELLQKMTALRAHFDSEIGSTT
jgi:hypothetical protein